jgi:hypothetical protein
MRMRTHPIDCVQAACGADTDKNDASTELSKPNAIIGTLPQPYCAGAVHKRAGALLWVTRPAYSIQQPEESTMESSGNKIKLSRVMRNVIRVIWTKRKY